MNCVLAQVAKVTKGITGLLDIIHVVRFTSPWSHPPENPLIVLYLPAKGQTLGHFQRSATAVNLSILYRVGNYPVFRVFLSLILMSWTGTECQAEGGGDADTQSPLCYGRNTLREREDIRK